MQAEVPRPWPTLWEQRIGQRELMQTGSGGLPGKNAEDVESADEVCKLEHADRHLGCPQMPDIPLI